MSKAKDISWSQALAWRMRQQLLEPIGKPSAEAIVKRLGAVASSAGEMSIRARQARSRAGEVERAIEEGKLIKVFAFRGATHLMTPEDAGAYLALRASSRMWELPSWQSFYKLKPADWPAFRKAVREALANGPLTKDELKAAVTSHRQFKHLSKTFTDTLMKPLTWLGEMSFGPQRDGRATFQRLDSNPGWGGIPALGVAGPKVIEDYLRAYGPATTKNLKYWIAEGLGAGKFIRGWLASVKDKHADVDVDGTQAFILRTDLDALQSAEATDALRLLPAYDQWVMGPGTADANVVPSGLRGEVSRGANIVVYGGRVAGTWSMAGDSVTVAWSDKQKAPREQIAEEVERLAEIVERPLDWEIERS
jgi:hypothetical protein